MPTLQQLTSAQSSPEVPINENFETIEFAAVYGKKQSTTTGLVWGYYGGRWGGFSVVDGTFTLTASSTNYIVVAKATGVTTASTSNTNWNDATNYSRVYRLTTSASAVTAIEDHRAGPGGVHGGASSGGGGGGIITDLEYTASTTTADSDPGTGTLRWNNSTQASATTLFIDNDDADSTSQATLWAGLPSGSYLRIVNAANADVWQLWKVTATPVNGTGYYKFTVSLQAQEGGNIANATALLLGVDAAGGGGLTNFTDSINTAAPNATVPVVSLAATNAATDVDLALTPKGQASLSWHSANNLASGGNKRGIYAIDFQAVRAGTASYVASGVNALLIGCQDSRATSNYSGVVGGVGCTSSTSNGAYVVGSNASSSTGIYSGVYSGQVNTNAGSYSGMLAGQSNTIPGGSFSAIVGGRDSSTYSLDSVLVFSSGQRSNVGDCQRMEFHHSAFTSNATTKGMASNGAGSGSAPAAATAAVLQNNSTMSFEILVTARGPTAPDHKGWLITGLISRGANAASTALVGTPTVTVLAASGGASAWAVAAVANTTLGSLQLDVTGVAATNIVWAASGKRVDIAA